LFGDVLGAAGFGCGERCGGDRFGAFECGAQLLALRACVQ
jgi:hypothetical protein